MGEFKIQTKLWLPRPRHEVFPFFADARNLEALTPPWLKFEVLTPAPIAMQPGTLIDYRIRVHGLPIQTRRCDLARVLTRSKTSGSVRCL